MHFYFHKSFSDPRLGNVEYWQCAHCGFVLSKTHADLSDREWANINETFHKAYHGTESCPEDAHWVQRLGIQAAVIADLKGIGLIPVNQPWLDYGCGDGKLSDILRNKYGLKMLKFDHEKGNSQYLSEHELLRSSYGFVITTSVLEHLRNRKALDAIEALIAPDGMMGIHTLVAEKVPAAADWFYLLPVHCAFHTNKSMQLLFDQWGYASSIYHVDARLWIWFKTSPALVEKIVKEANARPGREKFSYHFRQGFMDYWKLSEQDIVNRTGSGTNDPDGIHCAAKDLP